MKATVSLFTFCLDNQSIDVKWGGKVSYYYVLLSISSFLSVNIYFIYLGVSILGTYVLMNIIPHPSVDPFIII